MQFDVAVFVSGTTAALADQQLSAGSPATVQTEKGTALSEMVGKKVLGKSHELLGTIISINGWTKPSSSKRRLVR